MQATLNAVAVAVPAPICNLGQCRSSVSIRSDALAWAFEIDYFSIRDVMLYAKYSRGCRQGTVSIFAPPVSSFDEIRPEKVDVYDIGIKTSWRGDVPGTFDITGFYNDFNQLLLLDLEDRTIVNVGSSTIKGFESDVSIRPFDRLSLSGSAACLDSKAETITLPPLPDDIPYNTLVQTVFANAYLPLTPKRKATIG